MTAIRHTIAAALLCAGLCGCGARHNDPHNDTRLHVSTGIAPVAAIVSEIGGDSVIVETLLPSGGDPEEFDPGTKALKQLSNSELYFSVGTLPFEERLTSDMSASLPEMRVIILSKGIPLIYGTHGDEPDPHTWMSARNLAVMGRAVAEALSVARPGAAAYFQTRMQRYENKLKQIDSIASVQLTPMAGKAFVVGHPSLSYMARDYSLRQLPLGSGTKEISAKGMRQRIDSVQAAAPIVFFAEPGTENDMARETARELGIPLVTVDPMAPDIPGQLEAAARALAPQ